MRAPHNDQGMEQPVLREDREFSFLSETVQPEEVLGVIVGDLRMSTKRAESPRF